MEQQINDFTDANKKLEENNCLYVLGGKLQDNRLKSGATIYEPDWIQHRGTEFLAKGYDRSSSNPINSEIFEAFQILNQEWK